MFFTLRRGDETELEIGGGFCTGRPVSSATGFDDGFQRCLVIFLCTRQISSPVERKIRRVSSPCAVFLGASFTATFAGRSIAAALG